MLCTWRLTASMVNDADGVIYVNLTVKIVNYAVNRQSLVTVTPLFTIVIYGAIFEWRHMCTTLHTVSLYLAFAYSSCLLLLTFVADAWSWPTLTIHNVWCVMCVLTPQPSHRQGLVWGKPWLLTEKGKSLRQGKPFATPMKKKKENKKDKEIN